MEDYEYITNKMSTEDQERVAKALKGNWQMLTLLGWSADDVASKPMIAVGFDIDEGGEYDGFYRQLYQARRAQSPNARWGGVIRFMLYGKDGVSTNGFFKGFIGSVEESNPGYRWDWDERGMAGKKVGLIFREEEYRAQDGEIRTSVKAFQARSVKTILDGVSVPEKKRLVESAPSPAPFNPAAGFTQVEDDDLPF